jgi:L-aspartate oxidase
VTTMQIDDDAAFDVVIVGAGIAALTVALSLPATTRIVIVSQSYTSTSSHWAKGGVAAASGGSADILAHADDTIAAGAGLNAPTQVRRLVSEAPEAIAFLISQGVEFEPTLEREAGHQSPRIRHANGDATGLAIMEVLGPRCASAPNITLATGRLIEILVDDAGVCGIIAERQGKGWSVRAPRVVLATGGSTGLWRDHTSPDTNIGTGIIAAYRAGAMLADLEFTQFHPTAIALSGSPLALATEALRGAGAFIVDEDGKRFLFEVDPAGELATRDRVALAMHRHRGPSYLDVRPIGARELAARFPTFLANCRSYGHDPFVNGPVPIRPAAHYSMGGIVAGADGETNVDGLYAVGECANSGVHGANRLASNSLLEGLVFARRIATSLAESPRRLRSSRPLESLALPSRARERSKLCALVDAGLGIERDRATLMAARADLTTLPTIPMDPWDAHALTGVTALVELMLTAATLREGSVGAHTRSDANNEDPKYRIEFVRAQAPRRVGRPQ